MPYDIWITSRINNCHLRYNSLNMEEFTFTPQECLESLISILNTPVGRRKNSEDVNFCVRVLTDALEHGAKITFSK